MAGRVKHVPGETVDSPSAPPVGPAVAVDVIAVLAFAIIGRSSHAEADNLAGVLHTAWPFLVGCLLGLVVSRCWRDPVSLRTGVIVWVCTVVAGLALRVLSGRTAQPAFMVVTTVTLALLLVGWRAGFRLVQRARTRRAGRPQPDPT